MSDVVQVRVDEPSGTITINRPDKRNALSAETVRQLLQAFHDLHLERRVRAIILTGSSPDFCSGTDLEELDESYQSEAPYVRWHDEVTQFKLLIETMLRSPKPIIAAVGGWVAGTGVALMLASDIVIATDDTKLLMPESLRGLSTGLTAPLLSFRIGTTASAALLLTAQPMAAQVAMQKGLIHEIVPGDFVWARSREFSVDCAKGARETHQMTKRMLNESIGETLFTLLSLGASDMATARTTDAAREGIRSFLEKRAPQWK